MRASTIPATIANTPQARLNRLLPASVKLWMRLERGIPGGAIIDPTSENTGIGVTLVAALAGLFT